ncbi:NAD-P-binding protein [Amylocystis lapponica]|nr:NAD-P-binding protein [Amylocystis lapponica]
MPQSAKVWLVTGASSGIGLAIAQYVLSQGDKVIATVRTLSKFPKNELEGATPLAVDFGSSDSEIRKVGEEALKIHGHIDVVVNNAGYGIVGPVEELSLDDVRAQFQGNVFGALALTQALLPSFRARRAGHILNVSSVGAITVRASWGAYAASKAALEAFTDAMSQELAPFNVHVFIVEPGYFSSRFLRSTPSVGTPPSKVYTAESQGYGALQRLAPSHVEAGQIGDTTKLAQRLYEVVNGTGLAKGLMEGQGGKGPWLRVPLGPDCGQRLLDTLGSITENVKALEPIWSSTDVEPERLKFYPDG